MLPELQEHLDNAQGGFWGCVEAGPTIPSTQDVLWLCYFAGELSDEFLFSLHLPEG